MNNSIYLHHFAIKSYTSNCLANTFIIRLLKYLIPHINFYITFVLKCNFMICIVHYFKIIYINTLLLPVWPTDIKDCVCKFSKPTHIAVMIEKCRCTLHHLVNEKKCFSAFKLHTLCHLVAIWQQKTNWLYLHKTIIDAHAPGKLSHLIYRVKGHLQFENVQWCIAVSKCSKYQMPNIILVCPPIFFDILITYIIYKKAKCILCQFGLEKNYIAITSFLVEIFAMVMVDEIWSIVVS